MLKRVKWRGWLVIGLGSLILLAAVGAWTVVLVRPVPRIDLGSYGTIREGMSQAEVERIIGVAPGDYSTGLVGFCDWQGHSMKIERIETWYGNTGKLDVGFDNAGRVCWKSCSKALRHDQTFFERIRSLWPW